MHLIEIRNLSKVYLSGDSEIRALDDISVSIAAGEFVAIVGNSGSGKSTLMNILGCLDFASYGTYCLDGVDISTMKDHALSDIRNKKIGFVFQSFNLIPSLNALENVELQLSYRGISRKERRILSENALERVGLKERMYHTPAQMSGGQQQRVAIARAIAARPPVILADEPTGNLDTFSSGEVMEILKELNREGKTIILITHDNAIANLADRRIKIIDGKIVGDSPQPIE